MVLFDPILIIIAIGIPLFVIFASIRIFVVVGRFLILLAKNHVSPIGRSGRVGIFLPFNEGFHHHGH
jgi:hypothetical protein